MDSVARDANAGSVVVTQHNVGGTGPHEYQWLAILGIKLVWDRNDWLSEPELFEVSASLRHKDAKAGLNSLIELRCSSREFADSPQFTTYRFSLIWRYNTPYMEWPQEARWRR